MRSGRKKENRERREKKRGKKENGRVRDRERKMWRRESK